MDTLTNFALNILATEGGSAVLLAVLGWLLRTWIVNRPVFSRHPASRFQVNFNVCRTLRGFRPAGKPSELRQACLAHIMNK